MEAGHRKAGEKLGIRSTCYSHNGSTQSHISSKRVKMYKEEIQRKNSELEDITKRQAKLQKDFKYQVRDLKSIKEESEKSKRTIERLNHHKSLEQHNVLEQKTLWSTPPIQERKFYPVNQHPSRQQLSSRAPIDNSALLQALQKSKNTIEELRLANQQQEEQNAAVIYDLNKFVVQENEETKLDHRREKDEMIKEHAKIQKHCEALKQALSKRTKELQIERKKLADTVEQNYNLDSRAQVLMKETIDLEKNKTDLLTACEKKLAEQKSSLEAQLVEQENTFQAKLAETERSLKAKLTDETKRAENISRKFGILKEKAMMDHKQSKRQYESRVEELIEEKRELKLIMENQKQIIVQGLEERKLIEQEVSKLHEMKGNLLEKVKSKNIEAKNERDESARRFETERKLLEDTEERLRKCSNENTILNNEVEDLKKELLRFTEEIRRLEEQRIQHETTSEKLQKEVTARDKYINTLIEKNVRFQEFQKENSSQRRELMKALGIAEERIQGLEFQKASLKTKLERVTKREEDAQKRLENFRLQTVGIEKFKEVTELCDKQRIEAQTKSKAWSELQVENQELSEQVKRIELTTVKLGEFHAIRKENSELRRDTQRLSDGLNRFRLKLMAIEKEKEDLNTEKQALIQKYTEVNREKDALALELKHQDMLKIDLEHAKRQLRVSKAKSEHHSEVSESMKGSYRLLYDHLRKLFSQNPVKDLKSFVKETTGRRNLYWIRMKAAKYRDIKKCIANAKITIGWSPPFRSGTASPLSTRSCSREIDGLLRTPPRQR